MSDNEIYSSTTVSSTISNAVVENGGYLEISPTGESISTTINSGGTEYVDGGVAKIDREGHFYLYWGSATGTIVNNGGILHAEGPTNGTQINSGGTEYVYDGETGAVVHSGGSLYLCPDTGNSDITVDSGGNLYLYNTPEIDSAYINDGANLNIYFNTGLYDVKLYVENNSIYKEYQYSGKQYTSIICKLNNNTDLNGYYLTELKTSSSMDYFSMEKSTPICFLRKTKISTPQGLMNIEDINIGDEIITFLNKKAIPKRVIWSGKAHCIVNSNLPDDKAGYPVRILKNAIADNIPFKDMLITAEHSLFFNGNFVPARMLVNGSSIFYDKSITSYDYYHIETQDHSVIMADGTLTESYLDTGNRHQFHQHGAVVAYAPTRNLTWNVAAASLNVSREFVEPLFHQIKSRANKLNYTLQHAKPLLTKEINLHLITDTGAKIRQIRECNGKFIFMIPKDTKYIRILSRSSRPSDVIGPFVDDRRYLGVAVANVTLLCGNCVYEVTSHLQPEKPEGWHSTDWTDCAWTDGNAILPLDNHLMHENMGILSMTIRAAGPYLANRQHDTETALRSA